MHPISGVGFCGPRSRPGGRSLRSSAPPPDLGHLDDESLADYLTDALEKQPIVEGGPGQGLAALGRHQDRVLEAHAGAAADVWHPDQRLHGERHPGLEPDRLRAREVLADVRRLVRAHADAVTDEEADE